MALFSFRRIVAFLILITFGCQPSIKPPEPIGPLPSQAQLDWQRMEMNMFLHFNMNTFTNMEWGLGGESPEQFNPTDFDARQWAQIAKNAGMRAIILTAKHHDGFCLWPSEFTEHSVKNSPWKNGKGDVLKELAEACKEYGLKMGVYLSPWDRNHAQYGTPEYITYFRNQLNELFTNYGEVFEFWIDGANGGDGYYGGANETRTIDRLTYYDWQNTFNLAFEKNPNVIIFSDAGPGCRWVGNEEGWAKETNWSFLDISDMAPGKADSDVLQTGMPNGDQWIPAEADVSIRPGWYYHDYEDHKVKSLPRLLDIYYNSVGRNALLLLNFPVDRRGKIHPIDSARIMEMSVQLKQDFKTGLIKNAIISASNVRGDDHQHFGTQFISDNDPSTYWAPEEGTDSASLIIEFPEVVSFNRILLQEPIQMGQRISSFSVYYEEDNSWVKIADQTTIGYKRLLRLNDYSTKRVKLVMESNRAIPLLSEFNLFHAPKVLVPPTVNRIKNGEVTLSSTENGLDFYYYAGSDEVKIWTKYEQPFDTENATSLSVKSVDPISKNESPEELIHMSLPKSNWKVVHVSSGNLTDAEKAIDENPNSWWESENRNALEEIIIDFGTEIEFSEITYLPMQERYIKGFISNYECYLSNNPNNFGKPIVSGEFSNIANNPIEQVIKFTKRKGRYLKFKAVSFIEGHQSAGIAELGVR